MLTAKEVIFNYLFHMKKLPIFLVCGKSPFHSFGGGYANYALGLKKVLERLDHRVFLLHLDKHAKTTALPFFPLYSIDFARQIEKIVIAQGYKKIIVWGIGPWGFSGALLKLKFKHKVILINSYFTSVKHEVGGMIKGLRVSDYGLFLRCKYFLLYYGLIPFLSIFEGYLLEKSDRIIINYNSTKKILKDYYQIPDRKFYYSSFFLDIQKIKKLEQLPKQYVLTVTRQDPRKGINTLLNAQKILIKNGYHIPLLIVGTGRLLEANKNLAKRLKVSRYVKFLGYVKDISSLFSQATVFCLPSFEEGAGSLALNEAMAYGKPIVASICDGIPEDIENQKSGLLFPVGNERVLAKSLMKFLDDPSWAKKMGKNAQLTFTNKFNFSKTQKSLERFLDNPFKIR